VLIRRLDAESFTTLFRVLLIGPSFVPQHEEKACENNFFQNMAPKTRVIIDTDPVGAMSP
jgi:hypothetical protein